MTVFIVLFTEGVGEGITSAVVLTQPIGARAEGLAEAYTAVPGADIFGLYYNPAANAVLKYIQFAVLYQTGLIEDGLGIIGLGLPFKHGTFTVSLAYYNTGKIELINPLGQVRIATGQTELLSTLTYSATYHKLSYGINIKYLSSRLVDEFTANSVTADIGILTKLRRLKLGLAVQNIGSGLKYKYLTDKIPLQYRVGITYDVFTNLFIATDIVQPDGDDYNVHFGTEYVWKDISLRLGYKSPFRTYDVTFGVGLTYSRLTVDYALSTHPELGFIHHVGLSYRFGLEKI